MKREIPPMPTDTSPAGWMQWVLDHFPYDARYAAWLKRRTESDVPEFGTPESLDDLRGIPQDSESSLRLAAYCAAHWWHTRNNMERISKFHAAKGRDEAQNERRRLILLAKQALDGKLGESAQEKDDARATAQSILRQQPEYCSDDDLSDWIKMHQYCKKLARGWRGEKPKLAADLRREAEQRKQMADLDRAIDASPAWAPRGSVQEEMFG